MFLAQTEGAAQAIQAASKDGWTAVTVAATFFISIGFIAYLVKLIVEDKNRLAVRLTAVEDFQRKEIVALHYETMSACNRSSQALEKNAAAVQGFTDTMNRIPHAKTQD